MITLRTQKRLRNDTKQGITRCSITVCWQNSCGFHIFFHKKRLEKDQDPDDESWVHQLNGSKREEGAVSIGRKRDRSSSSETDDGERKRAKKEKKKHKKEMKKELKKAKKDHKKEKKEKRK